MDVSILPDSSLLRKILSHGVVVAEDCDECPFREGCKDGTCINK